MNSEIIMAAAGAGKTEELIRCALHDTKKRILITTYTNKNVEQVTQRVIRECGVVPPELHVQTWFSFLLREAVKPYQSVITAPFRIRSINFQSDRPKFARKTNFDSYYLDCFSNVYQDAVCDLACKINGMTDNAVIGRLEQMYDMILIDELQDLVGYDLDFIDLLMESRINLVAVGDLRQFTYASNRSSKNKPYRGFGMYKWVKKQQKAGKTKIRHMNWSHRCNQNICDFSDAVFPDQPSTISKNQSATDHDGIFLVALCDVPAYVKRFNPIALRWDKRTKSVSGLNLSMSNIGQVKGASFDRVLIFPTKPMLKYLSTGDLSKVGSKEKFYVGITRARYSVAFVVSSYAFSSPLTKFWTPNSENNSQIM